jgi:hypothetical protein
MPILLTVFVDSLHGASLMFMHALNDTTLAAAMDASTCVWRAKFSNIVATTAV